ncbi:hypothetical protein BDW42DRAFT_198569 [Aspergillus taichungensis]|uniref:Uncharacterized protein n=1 Tax=Aspergillus taichungensis TaxID=482145 RepID=A0A2J5HJG3_9EURO|nr:hypothetical protein BDW42DRAFT_198569 [Aspergillus taichungensis]
MHFSRRSRRSDKASSKYTCDCPNGTTFSFSSHDTSGGWTPRSMFVNPNPSSSDSSTRRASRSSKSSSTSHHSSRRKSTANSDTSSHRKSTAYPKFSPADESSPRGPFRTHRRTPVYTFEDPTSKPPQPSRYYDSTTVFEGDTRWYLSLFSTDLQLHRRVWYVFFPVSGQPTDAELVAHLQDCTAQVTDPMKALEASYETTGSGVWVEFATPCRSSPDQALGRLKSALEGLARGVAQGGQLPIDTGPMYT